MKLCKLTCLFNVKFMYHFYYKRREIKQFNTYVGGMFVWWSGISILLTTLCVLE